MRQLGRREAGLDDGVDEGVALAGLGLGLLNTAAVSLSRHVSDLPLAGAEVVRLAFRLGVVVDRVSSNLVTQDPTSPPGSWAAVVPDVVAEDVQEQLDLYHAKEVSTKIILGRTLRSPPTPT